MPKHTILLIDDDKFILKTIKSFLTGQGFHVLLAPNGEKGLKTIQKKEPDLIICDRSMPKLSGYDLLKSIREEYPQYNTIPFIFLTSLDDPRDKITTDKLKPTAYLSKPINTEELAVAINEALNI